MVDIQAARAADAAARTHCPALPHQTAISPKERVISEKRTTIGTGPMLLLVLVREGVVALTLVLAVARSLLLLEEVFLGLATRLGIVVPGFAHAAGDALGARIQSSPQPRGVAQLVEHRSPKPGVAGSSPVAPVGEGPANRGAFAFKTGNTGHREPGAARPRVVEWDRDAVKTDPMSARGADLIEANFVEFLLSMGRAGGAVERLDDEIAWTIGGSPIGYHNAVVRCTASEGRSGLLVEEWRDALTQRSLPGSWHWTSAMHPQDLPQLLLHAGFEDGGDEPAMAAQLAAVADVPMPTELQVTPVEDSSALDQYRHVLATGFGEGPVEADWVAGVFAVIGLEPNSRWRHFVGTVADDPVATASTLLTDSTAGIYFVCTRPDARRRGFGSAITYEAMRHAARTGATFAVLGSSPMGQRIYERLGFRTIFSTRLFELAA